MSLTLVSAEVIKEILDRKQESLPYVLRLEPAGPVFNVYIHFHRLVNLWRKIESYNIHTWYMYNQLCKTTLMQCLFIIIRHESLVNIILDYYL